VRLAIVASHPIQYQAPLFRELSRRMDVVVFYAHRASREDQSKAGFGVGFDWDVDLLSGHEHRFLDNVSRRPGLDRFAGCDTPSIGKELADGRYDALLVTGWHLKSYWQAIRAAKRSGIPLMVRGDSQLDTPRGVLKRLAKALVYPVGLRVFDIALYVGARSRRYWERYGFPHDRLVFSPHCVDNAWFAERATEEARHALRAGHGIAPDARVVLFAGKLVPLKRPLDLVNAAGALAAAGKGVTLLVAGDGMLAPQVVAAAAEARVKLVHLGFCNQSAMPAVYAAADALVLPSDSETWGLVANEALACGRAVIVSDACGCAPDLAADNTAGCTFPVGDVAGLAGAIARTLEAPPAAAAIGEKASRYSLGAAADGICRALEMLASRRARAA
jgi:glycosyltransferase involved in cell wall biosynthesis